LLVQEKQFGEIRLRKHKMFDVVFAGGESIGELLAEPLREPLKEIDEQNPGAGSTWSPRR
jgi:hypothetical protein